MWFFTNFYNFVLKNHLIRIAFKWQIVDVNWILCELFFSNTGKLLYSLIFLGYFWNFIDSGIFSTPGRAVIDVDKHNELHEMS